MPSIEPPKKVKVLPSKIHNWRLKRWSKIHKRELRPGDARRVSVGIQILANKYNSLPPEVASDPKVITRYAVSFQKRFAQLTDEVLAALGKKPLGNIPGEEYGEEWEKMYLKCMREFYHLIPLPIRAEIKRQRIEG